MGAGQWGGVGGGFSSWEDPGAQMLRGANLKMVIREPTSLRAISGEIDVASEEVCDLIPVSSLQ